MSVAAPNPTFENDEITFASYPFPAKAIFTEMTLSEYHAFVHDAPEKYEFVDGKVIKMSGGTLTHNRIAANFMIGLGRALEEAGSNCEVLGSDQKVFAPQRFVYFPDITILCGEARIDSDLCLLNPTAIIEVLSPSTAAFDMGDKFRDYRAIPLLQHYLLVKQDAPGILHYSPLENGYWSIIGDHVEISDSVTMQLSDCQIEIPLSLIYRRVDFSTASK